MAEDVGVQMREWGRLKDRMDEEWSGVSRVHGELDRLVVGFFKSLGRDVTERGKDLMDEIHDGLYEMGRFLEGVSKRWGEVDRRVYFENTGRMESGGGRRRRDGLWDMMERDRGNLSREMDYLGRYKKEVRDVKRKFEELESGWKSAVACSEDVVDFLVENYEMLGVESERDAETELEHLFIREVRGWWGYMEGVFFPWADFVRL